jgi:DNA-binding NtrC family response regulator
VILVVDQDPEVLEEARRILNRNRQVFLASSAEQAIEMVERLGFSVVLVDLDIPGAYALIQTLHNAHPDLLFIGVSGAIKASMREADKRDMGIVELLKKPITPEWKPVVERVRAGHTHR